MVLNWGVSSCLGAVALYLLSRRTCRDVEFLKSVTKLEDLAQLIEAESTVLPSIIAVSGRVGSELPIKCEHSGILGVIVEETSEPSSLVRGTLDYLRGLKMLGVRRIERVLPIGTSLTVVGEAVKDGIRDVRIQKPEQGPFYVSPIPLNQLISKLGKWSRRIKNVSMGLALLGVILISKPLIEYILVRIGAILERRRRRLLRKRVGDAAAKGEERASEEGLEGQDENNSDGDAPDLCVVCLERKCNAVFLQCGHMCCCITCSLALEGKSCPLCRKPENRTLRIYRH